MRAPSRIDLKNRWSWLCPVLSVVLAAAVLMLFGFTWWSAILVALLLVCPALLLWGAAMVALDERRARHRTRGPR